MSPPRRPADGPDQVSRQGGYAAIMAAPGYSGGSAKSGQCSDGAPPGPRPAPVSSAARGSRRVAALPRRHAPLVAGGGGEQAARPEGASGLGGGHRGLAHGPSQRVAGL